jgi:hypothetical protein
MLPFYRSATDLSYIIKQLDEQNVVDVQETLSADRQESLSKNNLCVTDFKYLSGKIPKNVTYTLKFSEDIDVSTIEFVNSDNIDQFELSRATCFSLKKIYLRVILHFDLFRKNFNLKGPSHGLFEGKKYSLLKIQSDLIKKSKFSVKLDDYKSIQEVAQQLFIMSEYYDIDDKISRIDCTSNDLKCAIEVWNSGELKYTTDIQYLPRLKANLLSKKKKLLVQKSIWDLGRTNFLEMDTLGVNNALDFSRIAFCYNNGIIYNKIYCTLTIPDNLVNYFSNIVFIEKLNFEQFERGDFNDRSCVVARLIFNDFSAVFRYSVSYAAKAFLSIASNFLQSA